MAQAIRMDGTTTVNGKDGAVYTVRKLRRSEIRKAAASVGLVDGQTHTELAMAIMMARAGLVSVENVEGFPAVERRSSSGFPRGLVTEDVIDAIPNSDLELILAACSEGEVTEEQQGNC